MSYKYLTRPTYRKLLKDAVRMLVVRALNNFGRCMLVMVRIDLKEEGCCRIKVTAPLFYYGTQVTNLTLESIFDYYVENRIWLHLSEFFSMRGTGELMSSR
jgi:hypothetical protein